MKSHLIYIPFTGVGLHSGFRGNTWFAHRIKIFKEYTLKSLANQKNKDFLLWCSFRAEEKTNPLVDVIAEAIEDAGLNYVFTFDGLMYIDDKFSNYTLKTKIKNFLQMLWDSYNTKELKPLGEIWRHTWEDKNKTLPRRVAASLSQIKYVVPESGWIYMTRLDSDDMLHEEAVNLIQSHTPDHKKALVMDKGYMYNVITGQLGEWLPPTNPPFHTIIFPASVFFDPQSYLEYYGDFKSHEDIPRVFSCETLDLYKYCVTAHGKDHISTSWDVPLPKRVYQKFKYRPYCYTTSGKNISTRWDSRHVLKLSGRRRKNFMIGKEFTDPKEKEEILAQFGV